MYLVKLFVCLEILTVLVLSQKPCIPKVYRGPDNPITCVCNSTYCDEFPPLGTLGQNQAVIYTSAMTSGKRFDRTTGQFSASSPNPITITPDPTQQFQTIFGFGGAFTDAAGINIASLSTAAQQNLINAYFGPNGIGYTFGRVPMASCDFSTHNYSYDEVDGDMNLTHFALAMEDFNYKIPYIKMAQILIGNQLKLYASPWSAPAWMKTDHEMEHGGNIIGEMNGPYWQTWANYFVRFFEEYAKNGVNFWGVTMQNEPGNGNQWQTLQYNASMERDFAKGVWGQTLRANPTTKNLKLMVLDDQRPAVLNYVNTVFSDPDANNILDGLAVHWYQDWKSDPNITTLAHEKLQNKFILYTEACNDGGPPAFGLWSNGNNYISKIIKNLQNWVTGWVDWNICLSRTGGPNWVHNLVDAPIIVNNDTNEFEKQPMYYALGHLAKFIVPDSKIIGWNAPGFQNRTNLDAIVAKNPAGQTVVVIINEDVNKAYNISVVNTKGALLNLNLESRSWTTIVYVD